MGELKMLTSKDGLRLKKLLGISDEDYEEFKETARKNDERHRKMGNSRLVIDNKLPKIYVKKGFEKELATFYNDNMAGNPVSTYTQKDMKVNEGYFIFSFKDFLKIDYPDEMEVMRMIQEYSKPELLEQLKEMQERIESVYETFTIKFKAKNGIAAEMSMYDRRGVHITDTEVDPELFDNLDEIDMSVINTDFNFHIDTYEDDEGFGYKVRENIVNDNTIPSITLFAQMMVYLLNKNPDMFLITKENLNEKIKKDCNEGIQLHRELKQHLKKSDVPIYYVDKLAL